MIQAAENEVAEMARAAAKADSAARAAKKAEASGGQNLELQRLKVGPEAHPLRPAVCRRRRGCRAGRRGRSATGADSMPAALPAPPRTYTACFTLPHPLSVGERGLAAAAGAAGE